MTDFENEADQMIAQDAIAPAKNIEATIEAWFAKHFQNCPLAGNEQHYNIAYRAKEELKTLLSKL